MPSRENKTETAWIEDRKSRPEIRDEFCHAPAPGGSLRKCTLRLDHDGIHRDGALAWFDTHWA